MSPGAHLLEVKAYQLTACRPTAAAIHEPLTMATSNFPSGERSSMDHEKAQYSNHSDGGAPFNGRKSCSVGRVAISDAPLSFVLMLSASQATSPPEE